MTRVMLLHFKASITFPSFAFFLTLLLFSLEKLLQGLKHQNQLVNQLPINSVNREKGISEKKS